MNNSITQTLKQTGKSTIDIGKHCLKIAGRLLDISTLLDKKVGLTIIRKEHLEDLGN